MLLDNIHKMKPSADKRTQQDRKSRQGRWCRLHLQVMRGSFWMTEEQEVLQTALNTIITSLFTISHFRKVWLFSRYPLHRWQCMCGVYTSEVQNIAQHAFRTAVYVVLTTLSLHTHTQLYTCMSWSYILKTLQWALQHWNWSFDRQPPDYSFISLSSLNSKVIE